MLIFGHFGRRRRKKGVVAGLMELGHTAIEMNAGVGIGSSIDTLALVEYVGLPVGELRALRDALTEEVGPKFLEAEVFDAHAGCYVLKIDPTGGMEVLMTMGKHTPIVVEGEANFEYGRIFQEVNYALWESHEIQAKEEADSVACNL